jgi:hypothetical protein
MGVVRLVMGTLGHEHHDGLVARGYGVFYGVFYRLAQGGYPVYRNSSFGVRGYQVMTDADMSRVMGHERVRITGGAPRHMHGANDSEIFHASYRFEVFPWSNR